MMQCSLNMVDIARKQGLRGCKMTKSQTKELEYCNQGFDIRRSGKGWAVDKKTGKFWVFCAKFSTKKQAREYIDSLLVCSELCDNEHYRLVIARHSLQNRLNSLIGGSK